jgi:hypothetical protein
MMRQAFPKVWLADRPVPVHFFHFRLYTAADSHILVPRCLPKLGLALPPLLTGVGHHNAFDLVVFD